MVRKKKKGGVGNKANYQEKTENAEIRENQLDLILRETIIVHSYLMLAFTKIS